MTRLRNTRAGFTLVEVMLALAILLSGLVVLIRATAGNIYTSERAHVLGVATDLARGKMYEIEALLLDEGFQEMNQELEGTFEEQGWERIRWHAEIIKVELPDLSTIQGLKEQAAEGAASGDETGMLGGFLGPGETTGEEEQGGLGGMLLSSQYELFRGLLEQSIRKVILTVEWEVMGEDESMVVVCYFTDPAVVQGALGGAPLPGGAGGVPGEGGETPGGGQGPGGITPGGGDSPGGGERNPVLRGGRR